MTDSPDAPLGTVHRDAEHGTVRIGALIDATASAVWQALTEPDRLADRLGQTGLPLTMLSAFGAGLQVHIEDLVAHLAGRPERSTVDRWSELHPGYQAPPVLTE